MCVGAARWNSTGRRSKVKDKGHTPKSKVKWRPWRVVDELVAPLADGSRTSTVQIRASYF